MRNMRIDRKWFIEEYGVDIENKYNMQSSYLFDEYNTKVSPYISLIQQWSADKISERRIQLALEISGNVHKACKEYFNEYKEALKNKEVVMDLVAQKSLVTAVKLNPVQPKLVEMQLKRYDDIWNNKGNNENEINIPTTINVEIQDKRLPEEKDNKES